MGSSQLGWGPRAEKASVKLVLVLKPVLALVCQHLPRGRSENQLHRQEPILPQHGCMRPQAQGHLRNPQNAGVRVAQLLRVGAAHYPEGKFSNRIYGYVDM